MKRTQDKIKDYIDAQAYEELADPAGSPTVALHAYKFTAATSDLMARWLDSLADISRQVGIARALAGLRGVGKSHTLAAFGALVELADIRQQVTDSHVATSAKRLMTRRYNVVRINRGTHSTINEELCAALAAVFGNTPEEWDRSPAEMLALAAERAGDSPLVLVIDTAFGRQTRVQRDDGPILSELAQAAQQVSVFIALALDDDISGADGVNVSIAGAFKIDYLDPEHLYQVLDVHLFHKTPQSRAALRDVYTSLRAAIPGFNWSEPRFTALYPMHPLVADVSPAVRLYAPGFALLPFAAAAFTKVTNRPALSLVALDEVFDRVEQDLRKADDLRDAFSAYDQLSNDAVSQIPVMQRLQARLALKGLFILSLDGRGATGAELCAAMLLFDENSPEAAIDRVRDMLALFLKAAPADALRASADAGDFRYCFNISATAGFDAQLSMAASKVDETAMINVIRTLARGRFEDWPFSEMELIAGSTEVADCMIKWRGMGRRGRLIWQGSEQGFVPMATKPEQDSIDWEILVVPPDVTGTSNPAAHEMIPLVEDDSGWFAPYAVWTPAALTPEDIEIVRRLSSLRMDKDLIADFGDTARASERTHAALAERIWTRVYIEEGCLTTGKVRRKFKSEARACPLLMDTLTHSLAPLLAVRYPVHPIFTEPLGLNEVAHLVSSLFGGANQSATSVQELARLFALPLGLVSMRGDIYTLEAGDQSLKQLWTREVLRMTDEAEGEVVPITDVYKRLRGEPYGFLRETQQIVLSALVAQRRIELVTAAGERIGRRMLDLKLVWDEIKGIARSATLLHGAEELTEWARMLTDKVELDSIADPGARENVRTALVEWLGDWRDARLLDVFEALPDDGLTTRSWRLAAAVRRSYGAAADAVEAALVEVVSLEEGLQRVADAFADSVEIFAERAKQLEQIKHYISGLAQRERVLAYLGAAEPTIDDQIENARSELTGMLEDLTRFFDKAANKRFELLWREFHTRYTEFYCSRHAAATGAEGVRQQIEALTRASEWREFEALSALGIFNGQHWENAAVLIARVRASKCDLNVRQILTERPACACAFRLANIGFLESHPAELEATVKIGLAAYRRTLAFLSTPLTSSLESVARKVVDPTTAIRARTLIATLVRGEELPPLSRADVMLLNQALKHMATPPPVRVRIPAEGYGLLTREELRARLNQWADDLPNEPAIVEVFGGA